MEKTILFEGKETNYLITSDGHVFNKKTGKEVKGSYRSKEYHVVQLRINGIQKTFMTHRLVAKAFCANPNNYTIVDHIDQNKLNNNYTNLRWVTNQQNSHNIKSRSKPTQHSYFLEEIDDSWAPLLNNAQYYANQNGTIINSKTRQILKGTKRNGYIRIIIQNIVYSKHVLIWEAFNGKKPDGMVIDHLDGNRANNALSNLRLVTQSENIKNAYANGHRNAVKVKQYSKDGLLIASYNSFKEAADAVHGSQYAIKEASDRYGTSAGFFWIRENDHISIEEVLFITTSNKPKSTSIGVSQYTITGTFIKHYNSLKEAARIVGCASSTIKRAADAKRKGKNYYWILDNQNININDILP